MTQAGGASSEPDNEIPVVSLSGFQGNGEAWGKSKLTVMAWVMVEWLLVTNPLQLSSRLRVAALRSFGAHIGNRVIFRPRTRVKSPWKLAIGDDCWIGEGVWFHNQDEISIGSDCVISQDSFLTTGSHKVRDRMQLVTSPIVIESGVWVTARCLVMGGTTIGRSAVISPMSVVRGIVPPNSTYATAVDVVLGKRFDA